LIRVFANGQRPTANDSFMAFACIFVPDFPVEAIVRADPELRDHPVAVLEGKPPLEKVVSVNEEARHEGVHSGMTKLQAELCESVTLRDRSELQESAAHRALLDCALSFSPQVEDVAPDAVLLDLSGLEKLFGTVPKIAWKISQCASAMGLQTNVAVAGTLEAAILAARGFSGTTVVPAGKEAECLGGLRIELLFADESDPEKTEEVLQTFERWGVCRLRELAALPEVELSERLGQWGIELQRRSRGLSHRAFVTSDSPLIFEEVLELEYPLVLLEPLAFALNRMLEQLCARLQARALAAQELHLELMLENGCEYSSSEQSGGVFKRTIHLPIPLLDPKTFLKLLQLDLKAHPAGAPVTKIILRVEPAKPRAAQNGLFQPSSPEPEKLELTLARISEIVGEARAGSPELLNTHRREAFEMKHFTPSAAKNGNGPTPREFVTALRIFRPPLVVRVSHQNGRPSHIASGRRDQIFGDVLWAAGPWRSSGDWWERDAWMRDEWDIALQAQTGLALYRLVHDVVGGTWMLEGSYD
jgi:protein ImuB